MNEHKKHDGELVSKMIRERCGQLIKGDLIDIVIALIDQAKHKPDRNHINKKWSLQSQLLDEIHAKEYGLIFFKIVTNSRNRSSQKDLLDLINMIKKIHFVRHQI